MATFSDPPSQTPRILEILDPSSGAFQYRIGVLVPNDWKNQFPNKAWRTSIADIGLPKRESDKYPQYVLVDYEVLNPSRTFKDHALVWIFERLSGPTWSTKSHSRDNLIPAKFLSFVEKTKTVQDVAPTESLTPLTGDYVFSQVDDYPKTGKSKKTNILETLDLSAGPLRGELTDTWGVNTTEESLVAAGTPTDYGFGVKSGRVTPLGNGKSIKSTERYPDTLAVLKGSEHDNIYGIVVDIEKSLVDAENAESIADSKRDDRTFVEVKPVDKWHSITIAAKVRDLPEPYSWNEYSNFRAPNVLEDVGVIWDSNMSEGYNSGGVDNILQIIANKYPWTVEASVYLSGFVNGAAYSKIVGGRQGRALVTVTRTFSFGPPPLESDSDVYSFQPAYGMITILGEQVNLAKNAWKKGIADLATASGGGARQAFDSKMSIHQFGPVEHSGAASLTYLGDPPSVTGTPFSLGGSTPSAGLYPAVDANVTLSGTAELALGSSTVPLNSGQTFTQAIRVYPWRLGIWVKDVYILTVP